MDFFTLYLIIILPNLGTAVGITSTLAAITLLVWGFLMIVFVEDGLYHYTKDDKKAEITKRTNTAIKIFKWAILPVVLGMLSNLVPTSKQMMYLIGGYAVTNVQGVSALPENVVNAANKFLEDFSIEEKAKK